MEDNSRSILFGIITDDLTRKFLYNVLSKYIGISSYYLDNYKLNDVESVLLAFISEFNENKYYTKLLSEFNLDKIHFTAPTDATIDNKTLSKFENIVDSESYSSFTGLQLTPLLLFCLFMLKNKESIRKIYEYLPNATKTFDEFFNSVMNYKDYNIKIKPSLSKYDKDINDFLDLYPFLSKYDKDINYFLNLYKKINTFFSFSIYKIDKNRRDVIITYSALIAIYVSNMKNNTKSNVFNSLMIKGLTLDNLCKLTGFYNYEELSSSTDKYMTVEKLKRQIDSEFNSIVSNDCKNIDDILSSLIDTNALKEIFDKMNIPYEGNTLNELLKVVKKEETLPKEENNIDNFFDNYSLSTINYLNYVGKIYTLLLNEFKQNKLNKLVIKNENELRNLSILLASFNSDNKLSKFFNDNNITMDKILKLINSSIDFNDIGNTELNLESFALAFNGLPHDYSVTENDIITSVLNNKNDIISKIYSLNMGVLVNKNMNNTIDEYNKNIKEKELKLRKEKLSSEVDSEIYTLLSYASDCFKKLDEYDGYKLNDREKVYFSIMLALKAQALSKYDFVGFDVESSDNNTYRLKNVSSSYKPFLKDGIVIESIDDDKIDEDFKEYIYDLIDTTDEFYITINDGEQKYLTATVDKKNVNSLRYGNGVNSYSIYECLNNNTDLYSNIESILKLKSISLKCDIDMDIVDNYFYKLLFSGKDIKSLNISDVIESVISLSNEPNVSRYCESNGIKNNPNSKLSDSVEKYIDEKYNEVLSLDVKKLMQEYDISEDENDILVNATRVYNYLNDKLEGNIQSKGINDASILISYLLSSDNYVKYFNKNGVSVDSVLSYLGIDDQEYLNHINLQKEDKEILLYELSDLLKEYAGDKSLNIPECLISHSNILKEVTKRNNGNMESLKYSVENDMDAPLTKEQIIEDLESTSLIEDAPEDVFSVLTYGDNLSKHTGLIVDELTLLLTSDSVSETLDDINNEINNMYTIKPAVIKQKTIFDKILKKPDVVLESEKKVLNVENLSNVQSKVVEYIEKLNSELLSFDYIRRYYELYLDKLDRYIKVTEEKINEVKSKYDECMKENPDSNATMKYSTFLKVLDTKLNYFLRARSTSKTEFVKVHEAIINHFTTVQGLITVRDVLLPLLGNEVLLMIGKSVENEAIDLSSEIVNLLHSVLDKNIDKTKENLQKLEQSNLPQETVEKLHTDLNIYMQNIKGVESNKEDKEKHLTLK